MEVLLTQKTTQASLYFSLFSLRSSFFTRRKLKHRKYYHVKPGGHCMKTKRAILFIVVPIMLGFVNLYLLTLFMNSAAGENNFLDKVFDFSHLLYSYFIVTPISLPITMGLCLFLIWVFCYQKVDVSYTSIWGYSWIAALISATAAFLLPLFSTNNNFDGEGLGYYILFLLFYIFLCGATQSILWGIYGLIRKCTLKDENC